MKTTKHLVLYSLLLLAIAGCSSNAKENKTGTATTSYAALKPRAAAMSQSAEWKTTRDRAAALQQNIAKDPSDQKSKLLLAQLYMQEARITGEHPYYYPAALTVLEDVLKADPNNFEALAFKASVQLSQHHFSEALATGMKAKSINANNGFIYGVLCDANVELGNYDEAVKMSDMMQTIRPGLESYSRASYLREIYGNNQGAIEAMKLAFQAGLPGSEEASWAGNTLVHLYENTGKYNEAEQMANFILVQRPSYAFATASLGRIELVKGNYDKAIALLEKATVAMPEFSFYEELAKAYEAKGEKEKARAINVKVIEMLKEDLASGHYADMELALAYLNTGDHAKALEHAKIEYKRRPENIDVNATMAWVLYKQGNNKEALNFIHTALKMNTSNATLLYKAAVIENAAGNRQEGLKLAAKSKKINPVLRTDNIGKV